MEDRQKKELLARMRRALKEGRDERLSDLQTMRREIDHEIVMGVVSGNAEHLKQAMSHAKDRKMMATVDLEMDSGEVVTVQLGHVNEGEPYKKRPSVRASKRSRAKSASVNI